MRRIKLTHVGHPDVDGGRPRSMYVDADRVLTIEPGHIQLPKEGSFERHRQAMQQLFEEVERVAAEARGMQLHMVAENQEHCDHNEDYMKARDAAAALSAAYSLVARAGADHSYHPRTPCTIVSMACGTGLEHGVMLVRAHVLESPDEVGRLLDPWWLRLTRRVREAM